MKKEEILEKSRESKQDEGEEYVEIQSRKIGYTIFAFLIMFLAIFSFFTKQISTFNALNSLFGSFFSAEMFAKYRFYKNNKYLFMTIGGCVVAICFVVSFVIIVLG